MSLMRQSPEQDELLLLEEAELGESDYQTEEEMVQLRKEKRRRSSAMKKRISTDVSDLWYQLP